jgi:hypothetical protein
MNENLESIGESLEFSLAKENLLGIIGDLSDYTLNNLLGISENIPIISYFAKGVKATIAVRDLIFLEKVISFLKKLGETPNGQRKLMIDRIQNDESYRYKFGKFSLIALERYNDERKAIYLGIAAKYLAREEITFEFYQRFSHILNSLTVLDLEILTRNDFLNFARNTFYAYESLGLVSIVLKISSDSENKLAWKQDPNIIRVSHRKLTDWGETARKILLELPFD